MDASSIIFSSVHSENPDFRWLTKLKIQNLDASILKKLQDDPVLVKENKELKKALLEQKILVAELQIKMIAQQEQAKIIEENEGEKNHKKGGLNCVFGNFFFNVLDNCPQVQSLK